jgi:hypothetical protein
MVIRLDVPAKIAFSIAGSQTCVNGRAKVLISWRTVAIFCRAPEDSVVQQHHEPALL